MASAWLIPSFHFFERVAGENDLAARKNHPQEPPGFCGPQRLYER